MLHKIKAKVLAKNLKLHIKNLQLAEAIDLQGLKAKLGKKKPSEERESIPEEQAPVSKAHVKEKKTAVPKKTKKTTEKQSAEEHLIHEQPPEIVETTPALPETLSPVAEIAPQEPVELISSEVKEEILPSLPTLKEEVLGPIFEEPKVEMKVVEIEEPKIQEEPPKPIVRSFLSASRLNPDQLGPVEPRALLQPPKRKEEKVYQDRNQGKGRSGFYGQEAKSAQKPLWEPLKATQGTQYHAFSPHAKGQPVQKKESAPGEIQKPKFEKKPAPSQPVKEEKRQKGFEKPQKTAPVDVPPEKGEEDITSIRRRSLKDTKEKEKEREREKESRSFKKGGQKQIDEARLRRGIAVEKDDEGELWRKKKIFKDKTQPTEIEVVRPKEISVRLPVSVKDLAQQMKLKSSQLIGKLFLSGVIVTLNDLLDDETTVQLLGEEFGCTIHMDTREEERLRITDKSIREEIAETSKDKLVVRAPIVTFMGHVDHGKTSIIDKIRNSNRAQGEVGAITQHIGAFVCDTAHGKITILDTPGHEAFFQMRERGAEITDIVVLVVAGDEGMKQQTIEALEQARESKATIVVAINKCDRPNFDQDMVFRQLADHNLLPEAWGGQTLTVRCSALTGEGIDSLLEMLALQAEILELRADPSARARGNVIETEMFKGLGPVATLLVQNGTLRLGDSIVFETSYAKVKSMRDESGQDFLEAGPSMAVCIHGLSSLPSAGEEFIAVASEKEAKEIAEARLEGQRQSNFQTRRRKTLESMMEQASGVKKKVLNVIIRTDVQGSLEALSHSLKKITSDKVELNILSGGVGEISESDVELAAASKAVIIGYHTQVEAHAEHLIKELNVDIRLHSIIYHAHDDVKALMKGLLDKVPNEVYKGKAEVKAVFKSSQLGNIAGCQVLDGSVTRNCHARLKRGKDVLIQTNISSLKRFKEDVREVTKGTECGIVLANWNEYIPGDIIEAFEIEYLTQEL